MTRDEEVEKLAVGFIEATTEWDFSELPADVQEGLRYAARSFLEFRSPDAEWPAIEGTDMRKED